MVVCKCINYEEFIKTISKEIKEEEGLGTIISLLEGTNSKLDSDINLKLLSNNKGGFGDTKLKPITLLLNSEENKRYYLYSNRFLVFPEFLMEYSYTFNCALTKQEKNNDFAISSYTNKLHLNSEYLIDILNKSAKVLETSPIAQFMDSKEIMKNLSK